jgi:hypothetical protein
MKDDFVSKMAKRSAEALVRAERITSLPVDPFAIASSRDIVVQAKPDTAPGVSGMLVRHGNAFGILYATHIPSEGFQRFSVAHELGHYFLDGHVDHILGADGIHTSHAGFVSADPYELEADSFAAGLLMPTDLFKRAVDKQPASLSAVESLAALCHTSLTATGIRYAELTDDAIAIVVSTGQRVDFCFLSESMKSLSDLQWPRKGSPVPRTSETAQFNADPNRVARSERTEAEVDIMDWLGGRRSLVATEEVIGLGGYGKTLTVLSSESIGVADDEDDDEAELEESWTPRFRR